MFRASVLLAMVGAAAAFSPASLPIRAPREYCAFSEFARFTGIEFLLLID